MLMNWIFFATISRAESLLLWTGQQQLLCLARLLLRRPAVVCLDECTASVDPHTAALMQRLIQQQLAGCTVIQVSLPRLPCQRGRVPRL